MDRPQHATPTTTSTRAAGARRRGLVALLGTVLGAAVLVGAPAGAGAQVIAEVAAFGDAPSLGSPGGGARQAAMAATPTGQGYWVADRAGEIEELGDAADLGDLSEVALNAPIVGMEATSDGGGLWLVASDGGVFAVGSAAFHGSAGAIPLNQPIVDVAATPSGGGYWLAASDGGVFAYGDAAFHGSMGGVHLNAPVVGIESTPSGDGYWLVATDGGIFAFGDAPFNGSAGDITLNQPVAGMAAVAAGGYWLVGGDGGVFTYGDADFLGSLGSAPPTGSVVDIEPTPSGRGYWLLPSGTALDEQCEGSGYRVAYPAGWWTNGAVAAPCAYFNAEPLDVPPVREEYWEPAVVVQVSSASASAVAAAIRSGGDVRAERGGTIDGVGSVVIEWAATSGPLPSGTRSYTHLVPFPDGRSLSITTRSVSDGAYDTNKVVVDEMAASIDIIVLDVTTDPDTNVGATPDRVTNHLVDARIARAPGFDRFVLELAEGYEPTWDARYLAGPARRPGSGVDVDVEGDHVIQLDVRPARTHDLDAPGQPATYTGPQVVDSPTLENVTEAVLLGDFEGVTSWAIGVEQLAGFRVFFLADPARVVVDVNH